MGNTKREAHPRASDPRILDVNLADDGILFMINVQVFHPRGYALCQKSDGSFGLFGDGSERWVFSDVGEESSDNDAKWAAFNSLLERAKSHG